MKYDKDGPKTLSQLKQIVVCKKLISEIKV